MARGNLGVVSTPRCAVCCAAWLLVRVKASNPIREAKLDRTELPIHGAVGSISELVEVPDGGAGCEIAIIGISTLRKVLGQEVFWTSSYQDRLAG